MMPPPSMKGIDTSLGNWIPSPYGIEDRVGAINLITAKKIREAFELVKLHKSYSMAIETGPSTPAFGERFFKMNVANVNVSGITKTHYHEDEVDASIGIGTHLDCLAHIGIDDVFYNGLTGQQLNARPTFGVDHLSCDNVGKIVTRVVVLNMADYFGVRTLTKNQTIYPEDLVGAANKQKVCFRKGDALFIYTGWMKVWLEDKDAASTAASCPGIGVDAAAYLAEIGIVAIGGDTWAVEAFPSEPTDLSGNPMGAFQAHQILIPKHGVYIIENINPLEFLNDGHSEGLLVLEVPRLAGSVQTNVNPVVFV